MGRYLVVKMQGRSRYVIFDRDLFGYCTLPDDTNAECPNLLPLDWKSRAAAQAWLGRCYLMWEAGSVPAPRGWKPSPHEPLAG